MKQLRILPSAAGIIALTATIGFVDGQRERDTEDPLRNTITETRVLAYIATGADLSGDILTPASAAYRVKVKQGEVSKDVMVDATTGSVLKA
jgi:hypothetical protein